MTPDAELGWSLVIPVKVLARAKSRLTGLPAGDREKLVRAMVADTLAAAAAAAPVAAVVVVTDDPAVRAKAAAPRAVVLPDAPAAGLNEALAFGAREARGAVAGPRAWPRWRPTCPPLQSAGARDRADRGGGGQAFVPDADGTGTTLYAAPPGAAFEPLFGRNSRRAARGGGAGRA